MHGPFAATRPFTPSSPNPVDLLVPLPSSYTAQPQSSGSPSPRPPRSPSTQLAPASTSKPASLATHPSCLRCCIGCTSPSQFPTMPDGVYTCSLLYVMSIISLPLPFRSCAQGGLWREKVLMRTPKIVIRYRPHPRPTPQRINHIWYIPRPHGSPHFHRVTRQYLPDQLTFKAAHCWSVLSPPPSLGLTPIPSLPDRCSTT